METKLSLIQDADIAGKVVLVRIDHNVVKNGEIEDTYRIDFTFETINFILQRNGKPILMTHVGRPKDKKTGFISINDKTSVEPIVKYLRTKLSLRIEIPELKTNDDFGIQLSKEAIQPYINRLINNELDVLYLPNVRWFNGEEAKGEVFENFAKQLASLGEIFVNDAFGSWQTNASTTGINSHLPSFAGFLMQKEINNLDKIFNARRPLLAVVAGSKFDTKITSLYALIKKVDKLVLGGVLYNAYLCAKYGFSIQSIDNEDIILARQFVEFAVQYPNKIVELPFIVESDSLEKKVDGKFRTININDLKAGDKLNFVLDASPQSFENEMVRESVFTARTIFINAVMGFTPNFSDGTIALYNLISDNVNAQKLFAGGDTNMEFKRLLPEKYYNTISDDKFYLFTGGGAVLNAIEEGTAFGIEPIKKLLQQIH
jgi:phosphoglycerate kinase